MRDPVAAVTHPDPYPYYAELVARRPLYRDDHLGLWVASSAEAVTAVLTHEICRVRPAAEPVPRGLLGSPAAEIFGRLIRMNDGERHDPLKHAVAATLDGLDAVRVATVSRAWARTLADEMALHAGPGHVTPFAFRLTAHVVASLLGVSDETVPRVARWTDDFVRCLAPGSSAEAPDRGAVAAGHLLDLGRALLSGGSGDGVVPVLAGHAARARGDDTDAIVANAVGFLSQSYEATAGLIGNTLLALARRPDLRRAVATDREILPRVLLEVLRHDPPVQNTRRFLARDGIVAGQPMKTGESVLVVLAAANRDPAANPEPERFDIARSEPRVLTFGVGSHACPGSMLATMIAEAGIEQVIASGPDLERLADVVTYRPSVNARIPLFGQEHDE